MNQSLQYLVSQVGYALPSLIVTLLAVILAAVNMSRAYLPSVVTLLASGMLIFLTVARIALSMIVYSSQQYSYLMAINMISNLFEAIALGCIVIAVFLGRTTPALPAQRQEDDIVI